jgi:hypothetical protein
MKMQDSLARSLAEMLKNAEERMQERKKCPSLSSISHIPSTSVTSLRRPADVNRKTPESKSLNQELQGRKMPIENAESRDPNGQVQISEGEEKCWKVESRK